VVTDRDAGALAALLAELDPERVRSLAGEVTDAALLADLVTLAATDFGGLDFLLPVAGVYPAGPVATTDDDTWRLVQDVNLESVFRLVREAIPALHRGGAIVTFASIAAHRGSREHAAYAASKAGVLALTRSLALELGPDIRVNAVSPGTIATPMTRDLVAARGDSMLRETALARHGEPAEVAAAALFLCSDAAGFITGEALHVNGGLFMAG
ncbi:SDR family NAD(P)-dependent oxidoreductase, partial [Leucobacter sp. M11]|uniref:SDR family NAD(P)-dependent oxidoreductase n=1 Tax=Leucobacter sp. M11 TaxID=2993565 RepID=UPI002D803701